MAVLTPDAAAKMISSGKASMENVKALVAAGKLPADFAARTQALLDNSNSAAAQHSVSADDLLATAGPRVIPYYVKPSEKRAEGYFMAEITGVPGVRGFTSRITPTLLESMLPNDPAHDSQLHASAREFIARLIRQQSRGVNPLAPIDGWSDPLPPAPTPARAAAPHQSGGAKIPAGARAR